MGPGVHTDEQRINLLLLIDDLWVLCDEQRVDLKVYRSLLTYTYCEKGREISKICQRGQVQNLYLFVN